MFDLLFRWYIKMSWPDYFISLETHMRWSLGATVRSPAWWTGRTCSSSEIAFSQCEWNATYIIDLPRPGYRAWASCTGFNLGNTDQSNQNACRRQNQAKTKTINWNPNNLPRWLWAFDYTKAMVSLFFHSLYNYCSFTDHPTLYISII